MKQLQEFAGRRKAKYGEFKDIFGPVKGLKLNHLEILHRNTFLNAVQQQESPAELELQISPIDLLITKNLIPKVAEPKTVSFRDGL